MKSLFIIIFFSILCQSIFAQTNIPQFVNMQAVARNSTGQPIANQAIQVKLRINETDTFSAPLWCNVLQKNTNNYGSFSIQLNNEGIPFASSCDGSTLLNFEDIPWETGNKILTISFLDTLGTQFEVIASIELASVFYALVCETCETLTSIDLTNINQGDILAWDTIQQKLVPKTLVAGPNIQITESASSIMIEGSGSVPIGSILAFAGDTSEIPNGWLLCDGQSYAIAAYPDLYQAINAYWGTTNPGISFKVPDLRGQFLRGVDMGAGVDPDVATRTPQGVGTANQVGTSQQDEFKSHLHSVNPPSTNTSNAGNHTHNPTTGSLIVIGAGLQTMGSSGGQQFSTSTLQNSGDHTHTINIPTFDSASTGGNETRGKNMAVYYIIKAED